nr:MAG: hypothetical protein [Microvirus sp.]
MRRKRMSKCRSGKYFTRTAKRVNKRNVTMTSRGGRRI